MKSRRIDPLACGLHKPSSLSAGFFCSFAKELMEWSYQRYSFTKSPRIHLLWGYGLLISRFNYAFMNGTFNMDQVFMLGVFNLIQIVVHQTVIYSGRRQFPMSKASVICVHTLSKNGLFTNFNVLGWQ